MKLYSYFRSSASYRVRIALNLKHVDVEMVPVNLLKGEQKSEAYLARNPQGLVPALELDDGTLLTQSMAIMEYLDEIYPDTRPILPDNAHGRARVRALCQAICCEIAPLNNLRVINYVANELEGGDEGKLAWIQHWTAVGLKAVETMLASHPHTGMYCHGDTPTMADCCLVPQVFSARRFDCSLEDYPTIRRIVDACEAVPEFEKAHPANQPDAQ